MTDVVGEEVLTPVGPEGFQEAERLLLGESVAQKRLAHVEAGVEVPRLEARKGRRPTRLADEAVDECSLAGAVVEQRGVQVKRQHGLGPEPLRLGHNSAQHVTPGGMDFEGLHVRAAKANSSPGRAGASGRRPKSRGAPASARVGGEKAQDAELRLRVRHLARTASGEEPVNGPPAHRGPLLQRRAVPRASPSGRPVTSTAVG